MDFKITAIPALACALAACTAPMTYPDSPTMQTRANWVRDWDHLADEAASDFLTHCQCDTHVVFVAWNGDGDTNIPFARAYKKLLEEKLHNKGVNVAEKPVPATAILRFNAQTFLYDHVGRVVPAAWLWAGALSDALISNYDISRAEVLLTLSVSSDGGLLQYRKTTEFYARPSDLATLYNSETDARDGHWLNGNRFGGVWAEWPESLDSAPGPERKMAKGMTPDESP